MASPLSLVVPAQPPFLPAGVGVGRKGPFLVIRAPSAQRPLFGLPLFGRQVGTTVET